MLDRPRHAPLIEEMRATGAAIRLIGDGDVAGIIHTTEPEQTGIDIYLGIGGAPEGVLAAAALRCIGGQMQGRLVINSDEQRDRARRMGVTDINRKFDLSRDGARRRAVRRDRRHRRQPARRRPVRPSARSSTHTVVMRSSSGTVRWIKAEHQDLDKFDDAKGPG